MLAIYGCAPQAPSPAPGAASRPAGEALVPLPPRAMTPLAKLQPPLAEPASRPYGRELPAQARRALLEAQQLIQSRNISGAIDRLDRASRFDPDNPQICRLLGTAYLLLPDRGKAMEQFARAVKNAPDDLESHMRLGELLAGQGQVSAAILEFRTASLCPGFKPSEPAAALVLYHLGNLLESDGCWTASLECFDQLAGWIEKNGRSYTSSRAMADMVLHPQLLLSRRGSLLAKLRQPAQAVELLDRAYKRDRSNAVTARLLTESLIAIKQFDRAAKTLVEMATNTAQMAQAAELAVRLCNAAGDKTLPMRIWNDYRAGHAMNPTFAVALASASERIGAPDQALELVKIVLKEVPDDVLAGQFLAGLCARRGMPEDGLRQLAAVLAVDESSLGGVNNGIAEIASGKLPDDFALNFANKVIAEKKYTLHYVAGRLAQEKGKRLLAADQFKRCLDQKNDFLPAYEALVDVYLAQRQNEELDRILKRLAKLSESGYFTNYIEGKIRLARQEFGPAVPALEQSVKDNPGFTPALLLLAEAYLGNEQYDQAEQTYLKAIEAQNDNPQPYRKLFDLYLARRQNDKAEAVMTALLNRNANSVEGRIMQAQLLTVQGKLSDARNLLDALSAQIGENEDVDLLRIGLQLGTGAPARADFDRSVKRLRDIIRKDPSKSAPRQILAELLNQPGRHGDAAHVWGMLYEETSRPADLGKLYAAALIRAGQFAAASRILEGEGFLKSSPKDALLRRLLRDALEGEKKYDQAIAYLEQWAAEKEDLARSQLSYRWRLARLYGLTKQYDKAQKTLDACLSASDISDGPRIRNEKLHYFVAAGQYDKAVEYAQQWYQDSAESLLPRLQLGYWLGKYRRHDQAVELLDKWMAAKPSARDMQEYKRQKLLLLADANKLDQAVELGMAWVKDSSGETDPRQVLIAVLLKANRIDEAEKLLAGWLKNVAATRPAAGASDNDELLAYLREQDVRLLMLRSRPADALARADAYLRVDPNASDLRSLKATALSELGKTEQAVAVLEALQSQEPTPRHANDLGYFYAERGEKLDLAEKMLREAIADPNLREREIIAYSDSLAWVLYKQGRILQAGRIFEQILRIDMPAEDDSEEPLNDEPVIYDHAGDTYYRLGCTDKAVELWTRAAHLAEKDKNPLQEVRAIQASAPAKIKAVRSGKEPRVAPLGAGIAEPPK